MSRALLDRLDEWKSRFEPEGAASLEGLLAQAAARRREPSDLAWLLNRVAALSVAPRGRADVYESLDLPLTWEIGNARTSRSHLRLPGREFYCHREPLLRRSDISLASELQAPPLSIERLARPEARKILDLILDTSAMR